MRRVGFFKITFFSALFFIISNSQISFGEDACLTSPGLLRSQFEFEIKKNKKCTPDETRIVIKKQNNGIILLLPPGNQIPESLPEQTIKNKKSEED